MRRDDAERLLCTKNRVHFLHLLLHCQLGHAGCSTKPRQTAQTAAQKEDVSRESQTYDNPL